LNQTYQYDTPAVPGASSMDSLRAAMQANPNADPIQLMRVAQAYSALQPKPAKGMSAAMAYRIGRDEKTDANKVIAGDKKLKTRRGTTVTTLLGEEFGSLLEGTDAEIAARFEPSTKPIIGERTWDRPETWGFGDREIGTVTTGESGPLKLRAFVGRRVRDMAMWMLNNNYDESDVKIVMARMKEAGMASGKFDFVAAWGAVPSEIAENIGQRGGQQQAQGSVSQREANLNITRM
jgi:hypothetical protein